MTTYSIEYKTNEVIVEVKGHAGYDDKGYDIVCSSISTACILTANTIDNLGYNIKEVVNEDGYFKLQVETDSVILGIIKSLGEILDSLEKQYPKYIKMKK